jgi:hypothetical protein
MPGSTPNSVSKNAALECYAEMSKCFVLEGKELHEQVADLFNRQHEGEFSEDQCGYGGRIREKRVAKFLEEQGSVLLQGRLGVRPSPHLSLLQSALLLAMYLCRACMLGRETPFSPAMHYAHEATVDFTVPLLSRLKTTIAGNAGKR